MGKNKEKLGALIRELGEAISGTLIQSNAVQVMLKRIKDQGYQVDLSLAIGVCLYGKEGEEDPITSSLPERDQELRFEFNQNDLEFLNTLRIKLDKKIY